MTELLRLSGSLRKADQGDSSDVLFCGETIVAEWAEQLTDKQVSLQYWISDREETDEAIKRRALEEAVGRVDAEWHARYSDVTGYLWTDQSFVVGGHDMLGQLECEVGKYLLLEVTLV